MVSKQSHRKDEHVSLAEKFFAQQDSEFDQVRIVHQSLPELTLADVSSDTRFLGHLVQVPLLIEAMTGGSQQTGELNRQLAQLAAHFKLPMAVGSMSIALKEPDLATTFEVVRQQNPDGIVMANIGAGHSLADAQQAVNLIQADGLQIHLNSTQEVIMPEGDSNFRWLSSIAEIVSGLSVPVIVKEVGFGMSAETIGQLQAIGVQTVDLSGRGGTNFAMIENFRRTAKEMSYLTDWGLTTPESLLETRLLATKPTVIGSGGITTPLDAIKAIAMGADCVAMAGAILHHLIQDNYDSTLEWLSDWLTDFRKLMLLTGCRQVSDLHHLNLIFSQELVGYAQQRDIHL